MKRAWVYMVTNTTGSTLYTGVTSNLARRAWEHREGVIDGFTRKYKAGKLVWYEEHDTMLGAIQREKNIKHWSRDWKNQLVEQLNPQWRDLYEDLNK
jgi:putative endonuclease